MADSGPASADALKMDVAALNAFLRDAFPHSTDGTGGTVVIAEPGHVRMQLQSNDGHLRPGGIVSGPTQMALTDSAAYARLLRLGRRSVVADLRLWTDDEMRPVGQASVTYMLP